MKPQVSPLLHTPVLELLVWSRLLGQHSSPLPPQARQRRVALVVGSTKQWLPATEQKR
jgi:hypothetical protein